ncbi:hypothetical protein [Streptomyces sp. NPDC002564]|uniref:hypothetical protein n=1 Tax=Streptomyces sp. NPDC002564 TaxID=3364649 RepID=UPI0036C04258
MTIYVSAGDVTDRQAATDMLPDLPDLADRFPTITNVWADGGYTAAPSSPGPWPSCTWPSR